MSRVRYFASVRSVYLMCSPRIIDIVYHNISRVVNKPDNISLPVLPIEVRRSVVNDARNPALVIEIFQSDRLFYQPSYSPICEATADQKSAVIFIRKFIFVLNYFLLIFLFIYNNLRTPIC